MKDTQKNGLMQRRIKMLMLKTQENLPQPDHKALNADQLITYWEKKIILDTKNDDV